MFVKCMSKYNCGNLRIRYSLQSTERGISYRKEWLLFVARCCCEISNRNEIVAPVQKLGDELVPALHFFWWYHAKGEPEGTRSGTKDARKVVNTLFKIEPTQNK